MEERGLESLHDRIGGEKNGHIGNVSHEKSHVLRVEPQCRRIEVNLDHTAVAANFHEAVRGPASKCVPELCRRLHEDLGLNPRAGHSLG